MYFGSYLFQTIVLILVCSISAQNTTRLLNTATRNRTQNNSEIIRNRTPRYIVFPKKSNVVLSLVLLKATNVGRGLNTLHEIDFLFPLPMRHVFLQRQQKSMRLQIRNAFKLFGLNGTSCLKRVLCEIEMLDKRLKQSEGAEDLVHELSTIILGKMKSYTDKNQCESVTNSCSVSFLDLWHNFFDSVINYLESNRMGSS